MPVWLDPAQACRIQIFAVEGFTGTAAFCLVSRQIGLPKGVMVTHANMLANGNSYTAVADLPTGAVAERFDRRLRTLPE